MYLLVIITVLSLLLAFIQKITQPIKTILKRPSSEEKQIQKEISELRIKLAKVSMRDEYIEYVKIERKICALEQKLNAINSNKIAKDLIINYGVSYGSQAVLSIILAIISITFRNDPVLIFEKNFNFAPFGGLMKFPTGIDGAISVPFWIFVSGFTFRSIAGYFKL